MMITILIIFTFLIVTLFILLFLLLKTDFKPDLFYRSFHKINDVENYYNKYTKKYLEVVPSAIQSHRTAEEPEMFEYFMASMGISDGMRLLDAGCGVCGPAVYFASKYDIRIDAVTNSEVQLQISKENIEKNDLCGKISVVKGDYHFLDRDYNHGAYDVVYFLESYGHACDHKKALKSASKLLKKGGVLYIKDYFQRDVKNMKVIKKVSSNMNKKYFYNLPDLYYTLHILRNLDFEIIKTGVPRFEHDMGEKAVEFERNNNIDLFGEYKVYGRIAYADLLELVFRKT